LGKTWDRRGNLSDKFISSLPTDKGKELPPDGLHFAQTEAKTREPAGQAHEAAARFRGRRAGSLGRAGYGREQSVDVRLGSLLAKERENHPNRFSGDLGFNAGGRGNAGDQIFHLKPR